VPCVSSSMLIQVKISKSKKEMKHEGLSPHGSVVL
jgi:hypothetical protein